MWFEKNEVNHKSENLETSATITNVDVYLSKVTV